MTTFQIVFGWLFGLLILLELIALFSAKNKKSASLKRQFAWVSVLVCILRPELFQSLAGFFQIGRGADLLLYGLTIAFLFSTFWFISALERQRRQITLLVQELAKRNPDRTPTKLSQNVDSTLLKQEEREFISIDQA